jgi:hypothetical protein
VRFVIAGCVLSVLGVGAALAFDRSSVGAQTFGGTANSSEYLYTFNDGDSAFARYSIPDLKLIEKTPASDKAATNLAFGNRGLPYYVDTAGMHGQSGYGVYEMPVGRQTVQPVLQFSGLCGDGDTEGVYTFATGPGGNFYAGQTCPASVKEYAPKKTDAPKKPIAIFEGGNIGPNLSYPTALAVDGKGDVYIGDAGGGITYFAMGSKTPAILIATGHSGAVYEMTVDSDDNVWSTVADGAESMFDNDKSCKIDPNGSIERTVVGMKFSGGALVENLYSVPAEDATYNSNTESIAVDSTGRAYLGVAVPNTSVLEFPAGSKCPDPSFQLNGVQFATPEIAVDRELRFYVTDNVHNTITEYASASTTPLKTIVQPMGLFQPINEMIGP